MNLGEKVSRALRPDAQAFDEVRIVTVPRYKMSGMSGDEWRISAKIQLFRKGRLMAEKGYRNVEAAARFLDHFITETIEEGKAYYAGEDDFCDQEGCAEAATVTYQKKAYFCQEGHATKRHWTEIRKFCDKHSTRGDCGLDDADRNYTLIEGKRGLVPEEAMSPSGIVQVKVDSIDAIPGAMQDALKKLRSEGC